MAKRLQHDMTGGERNYTAWFVGAIVAVAMVIGFAIWRASDDAASTSSERPATGTSQQQTTGSAGPANDKLRQQPAGPGK